MKLLLSLTLILIFLSGCQSGAIESPTSENNLGDTEKTSQTLPIEISSLPEEYQRLTIPYLRSQSFPGSEIEILNQLPNGSNYSQQIVNYKSEDLTIQGLLTKPNGQRPESGFPAIVFVHGYIPPQSYQTTQKYEDYVDYLAQNGFVVFKIDLRGHGESQGLPNGAYYSSDYIYDVLNAYSSLQKLDYVNENKIGLWGHSMAGNLILRTMAVKPEIPIGVIWAGAVYTYTDMQEFNISDASYQPSQNPNRGKREELFNTVGRVDEPNNPFWPNVIATNFLNDIKGKIYLHHAVDDDVVPIGYSRNLVNILKDTNIEHELYEYESGGHNINASSFNSAMSQTVKNFETM